MRIEFALAVFLLNAAIAFSAELREVASFPDKQITGVGVSTKSGTVVLASDNAYLFENLEKHLAISQTLDAVSNLAAQTRMFTIASKPEFVIPGHDPTVFDKFPVVKPGVVRID